MSVDPIKDAPNVANAVDPEKVKAKMTGNHLVDEFVKLGEQLLEQTNKPNRITLAQFEPFIPLFNYDKDKLDPVTGDPKYRDQFSKLMYRYTKDPNGPMINLYKPVIVVVSEEDDTIVTVLPQVYSQIRSDSEGDSLRDNIPAALSRVSSLSRDELILEASLADLMTANNTPEQKAAFALARFETAVIQKYFIERNMSDKKKQELLGTSSSEEKRSTSTDFSSVVELDDSDD